MTLHRNPHLNETITRYDAFKTAIQTINNDHRIGTIETPDDVNRVINDIETHDPHPRRTFDPGYSLKTLRQIVSKDPTHDSIKSLLHDPDYLQQLELDDDTDARPGEPTQTPTA